MLIGLCSLVTMAAEADQGVLATSISSFHTSGLSFEDALRDLARNGATRFVIGFEVAGESGRKVNLSLQNVKVRDVLGALCAQDRRYTYADAGGGVIEVRPVQEPLALKTVLSVSVPEFALNVREWPGNVFARLPEFVSPLGIYLSERASEWAKNTGTTPPGSPGALMTTDVEPPPISIHLSGTTVRGVLNAIAAYTLHVASTGEAKLMFPTGWRVQFISDPSAQTGLGGYVQWSPFP